MIQNSVEILRNRGVQMIANRMQEHVLEKQVSDGK